MNWYKICVNIAMLAILIVYILSASNYILSNDFPDILLILYGQLTMVFAHYWAKLSLFLEDLK